MVEKMKARLKIENLVHVLLRGRQAIFSIIMVACWSVEHPVVNLARWKRLVS
jgi:hypothetical protein